MRRALVLALAVVAAARSGSPLHAEAAPSGPCAEDRGYGLLDFWLGEWHVYEGKTLAGHNRIEKTLRGCAVVESWKDADGSEGNSLFFYNRFTATWKQVWVHDVGQLKEKTRTADPSPGAVRFQGAVFVAPGRSLQDRTTLTRAAPDQVRQVIEVSRDDGRSWRTVFDAIYVRPGVAPPEPVASPAPSSGERSPR